MLAGFFTGPPALADFRGALKLYNEGEYEKARAEFLALAELGDGASQYNLGAMSLQGQGGPKDFGVGVGWLLAAAENGYSGMPAEQLASMRSKLKPEQEQAAQGIVDRYGRAALIERVLPQNNAQTRCSNVTPAEVVQPIAPWYPTDAAEDGREGIVIVAVTIGTDGLASDPEILMAAPTNLFEPYVVTAMLKSRYAPGRLDGEPIRYRFSMKHLFTIRKGGTLWNVDALRSVRIAAGQGDPTAQYLVGLAATLDESLEIPEDQANQLILSAAQGGHPHAQRWVADWLEALASCGGGDKSAVWLQQAASSGDANAQVDWAKRLIARDPQTPENIAEAKALLEKAVQSDDPYAIKRAVGLLAASPNAELRNPSLAVGATRTLLKRWTYSDPQALEAVAAAHAVAGDFEAAVSQQRKAIEMAQGFFWNTQAMDERLQAYQSGRAWTGDLFVQPRADGPLPEPRGTKGKLCEGPDDPHCKREPDGPKTPIGTRVPR